MEILGGCTEELSDFLDPLDQPKYLSLRRSSSCLTPCRALSGGGYLARWCFSLLDIARPSLRSQQQPSGGVHPLLLG